MNLRMTILLFVAALGMSLVLTGAATAKGPVAATITGPGLVTPLKLSYRNTQSRNAMGKLTSDGDFFRQAFGGSPATGRPLGSLGPRYLVIYTVPGPSGNSFLRQHLYPYADAGAVTFMAKGQPFWGTRRTRGGWSRGSQALTDSLVGAGLPAPPSND
jgi:hypothetical protein